MTAGRLAPGETERARVCRIASGEEDADLVILGGTVAAVDTGQLLRRDVLVSGRYIAAVARPGALTARQSLDASDRFVLPAFVSGHKQGGRPLLSPGELARLVVPRGTVTVFTDPAEVIALCGPRGGELATATRTPLRLLVAGLAEGHRPEDQAVREEAVAGDMVPTAACPAPRPAADVAAGGHLEADTLHTAVRAGMDPLDALRRVTLLPARQHGLDHVLGVLAPGHLADLLIVDELGQAEPPDLVLVDGRIAAERGRPLFDNTDTVPGWARGRVRLRPDLHAGSFALPCTRTRQRQGRQGRHGAGAGARSAGAKIVTVEGAGMVIAEVVVLGGGESCVRSVPAEPTVSGGMVVADPGRDLLKAAVVDRAGSVGVSSVGIVRGVGLRRGAVGVSASRAPGNLVVVGANDDDMLTAVTALEGMGGGFVAVDRGWVRAACPLPVAGVMSDAPWEAVVGELEALDAALADLGCPLPSRVQALAGLGDAL